jgi:hypothetical protein
MMGAGLSMRTGPICRHVQDAARILDVIAGYDPKDELTAFSIGRKPAQSYLKSAAALRLDGLRIGVIREYMARSSSPRPTRKVLTSSSTPSPTFANWARRSWTRGLKAHCFKAVSHINAPELLNSAFTRQYRDLFPPESDQLATFWICMPIRRECRKLFRSAVLNTRVL